MHPRPISPSTPGVKARPPDHPDRTRATTSPTVTATACLDAYAGLYCVIHRLRSAGKWQKRSQTSAREAWPFTTPMSATATEGVDHGCSHHGYWTSARPIYMSKVYFRLGGSDANETNIKLVWYYTTSAGCRRKEEDHLALARLSRLGPDVRVADGPDAVPPEVRFCPSITVRQYHVTLLLPPRRCLADRGAVFSAQCAADLEELIEAEGADTIAALIAEPMLGTGRHRAVRPRAIGSDHPDPGKALTSC